MTRKFAVGIFGVALAAAGTLVAAPASAVPACYGVAATIVGTESGDYLEGTAGPDVIVGLGGGDVIYGLGGDDILCGDAGGDYVDGGDGVDKVIGGEGNDNVYGGAGNDGGVPGVTNPAPAVFGFVAGDNAVPEGPVSCTLCGNDTVDGGPGTDVVVGDNFVGLGGGPATGPGGDDYVTAGVGAPGYFNFGTFHDIVTGDHRLSGGGLSSGFQGNDLVEGSALGSDFLSGDSSDDVNTDPGDDSLRGLGMNDHLRAGPGNDSMDGGANTDTCDGGPGTDYATRCETILNTP
jgi:Ca2+-binding RTX toxin-like protein